jgi:hypothetical protein
MTRPSPFRVPAGLLPRNAYRRIDVPDGRVVRAECPDGDPEVAAKQRFSFGKAPLLVVQSSQIGERVHHAARIGRLGFLADCDHPLQQRSASP